MPTMPPGVKLTVSGPRGVSRARIVLKDTIRQETPKNLRKGSTHALPRILLYPARKRGIGRQKAAHPRICNSTSEAQAPILPT